MSPRALVRPATRPEESVDHDEAEEFWPFADLDDAMETASDSASSARRKASPSEARRIRPTAFPFNLAHASLRAVTGFRGVVIIGILVFDTGVTDVGFLGLELLFVLLAFSATHTMLTEHHDSGAFGIVRFYLGRLKPLIPTLAVVLGITVFGVVRWGTYDEVGRFAAQSIASLLLISNWEQIGANAVYSETLSRVSPLGHLWVVALLEQFLCVWPLAVFFMLALGRRLSNRFARRAGVGSWQWSPIPAQLVLILSVLGITAGAAVASNTPSSLDVERIYLGTDTHLVGLFAGCAAAAISHLVAQRRGRLLVSRRVERSRRVIVLGRIVRSAVASLLSAVSVVVLVSLWARARTYTEPWLFEYGYTVTALICAITVLSLTAPWNQVNRLFHFNPFVGIGGAAYAIFVVHLPVFWIVRALSSGDSNWDVFIIGIPASLLLGGGLHHLAMEPLRVRRWSPQGIVVITAVVAAACVALVYFPSSNLKEPRGTGRISVLALGDSLSNNLTAALEFAENTDDENTATSTSPTPYTLTLAGVPGCGLAPGERVSAVAAPCTAWENQWLEAIQAAQPDVIIIDASLDAMTRQVDGKRVDLTDRVAAQQYRESLDTAATMIGPSTGVLFANARLHRPNVTPEQASAFNALLDDFASDHSNVTVLDLQDEVCSEESCRTTTRLGEPMYSDDRTHFSDAGKRQLAAWLSDETLAAFRGATNAEATAR